jgi:diguanylate cyclase (GGDEF)-like protein
MLAWLVIACVVPGSLLVVGLIYHDYQQEKRRQARDALATARALSLVVDKELAGVQAALLALATSPSLAAGDLRALHAQAREVLRNQAANNIVLAEVDGKQRLNTLRSVGEEITGRGDPTRWRRLFEEGLPVVSDLFVGPVGGQSLVAIGVPVRHDGAVRYNLSMAISPDRLNDVLRRQHLPPDWVGTVLDSTGTIVARTHNTARFVGKPGAPALVRLMSEEREGAVETDTVEGIPVYAVFSRSAVSNWAVAIGIPRENLANELWHSLWWVVLATVALLAASLALAWTIGGRIARSIHDLIAPAQALGFRQEFTLPAIHLKEADEVGRALAEASSRLMQAQHQAHHDGLTGLANRVLFTEVVNQQLALSKRTNAKLALFYIDLDGFKAINDRHGHEIGDNLLRAVAVRLTAGIRSSDLAARLGGDEFAVVLVDASEDAVLVADKLVHGISAPYAIDGVPVEISASIGIAFSVPGSTGEDLLRRADKAMYEAKTKGKRRYAVAVE